jgi:3-methyladenine DNA glycosylase AlkD
MTSHPELHIPSRIALIESDLLKSGSAERRQVAERYFPTKMRVLGVPVPALRAVARALARELKTTPARPVRELAESLIKSGSMEGRQVAHELLALHKPAAQSLTVDDIERLRRGLDNWASVDSFAVSVAGPAWRRGQLPDSLFDGWTQSPDHFTRRLALVCTVALNTRSQGGQGDIVRTLSVCKRLIADRDEFVVKALSWALRELVPHDLAALQEFLSTHEGNLSRRVLREVRSKLDTGRKQ